MTSRLISRSGLAVIRLAAFTSVLGAATTLATAQVAPGVPGQCPPVHTQVGVHKEFVGTSLAAQGDQCFFGHRNSATVGFYEKREDESWFRRDLVGTSGLSPDSFGYSVDFVGSTAIVGDPWDTSLVCCLGQGAAAILDWDAAKEEWTPAINLLPPPAQGATFGYDVALSDDETLAVVGSIGVQSSAGAAHVYRLDAGTWVPDAVLSPAGLTVFDRFGHSIAIGDGRIFVGAPSGVEFTGTGFGKVWVFEDSGSGWVDVQALEPAVPEDQDYFGHDVRYENGRLFVGARGRDPWGAVFVFEHDGSSWNEVDTITASSTNPVGWFGRALDADGDRLAVGAKGRAYLFEHDGSEWVQTHRVGDPTLHEFSEFGVSVAFYDDGLLVGANRWDYNDPFEFPDDVGGVFSFDLTDVGNKLVACGHRVSVGDGGSERLVLAAPASAGATYWILGSATGFGPTPLGLVDLPLTVDVYMLETIINPNGGVLPNGLGSLDANGVAEADFVLPTGLNPGLVGLVLHHAFLIATAEDGIVKASNAVSIELID